MIKLKRLFRFKKTIEKKEVKVAPKAEKLVDIQPEAKITKKAAPKKTIEKKESKPVAKKSSKEDKPTVKKDKPSAKKSA